MPTWPFWLLFLGTGLVGLLAVKRLDDLERSSTPHEPEPSEETRKEQT